MRWLLANAWHTRYHRHVRVVTLAPGETLTNPWAARAPHPKKRPEAVRPCGTHGLWP